MLPVPAIPMVFECSDPTAWVFFGLIRAFTGYGRLTARLYRVSIDYRTIGMLTADSSCSYWRMLGREASCMGEQKKRQCRDNER